MLSLLLLLLCAPSLSLAYETGAPDSACASLTPGHGPDPQPGDTNPYTLAVDLSSLIFYSSDHVGDTIPIQSGEEVTLVLKKKSPASGADFMGFIVQAREEDGSVVGQFGIKVTLLYYVCTHCDHTTMVLCSPF